MAGNMCDQGEGITLEALFNLGLTLKLFTNDYEPTGNTTENNFTEATFPGYNAVEFNNANDWTITEDAPTEAYPGNQNFVANNTPSPPETIFGYWFEVTGNNKCVWAERFIAPRVILISGDYVDFNPKIKLREVGE